MNQVLYTLFPKSFQGYELGHLAEVALECGFDAVDLVVRDGFWVTQEQMKVQAETFVRTMQRYQLKVEFATTGFSAEMLEADDTPLRIMADLGIRSFRMSYFPYTDQEDLFPQLDRARGKMEQLAERCEKFGLKAICHLHHGDRVLIHHSLAALYIVKGLPPAYVGIMPDPGNQFHEGTDNWRRAMTSLGAYAAGIGVKDAKFQLSVDRHHHPDKGWSRIWAPCYEGATNWHVIASALQEIHFQGVLNFQPFYYNSQPDLLIPALKEEVSYIRTIMEKAGGDKHEAI